MLKDTLKIRLELLLYFNGQITSERAVSTKIEQPRPRPATLARMEI